MNAREWTLAQIEIGMEATFDQRIDAADVDAFARLSGDHNPLHMDGAFAQQAGFRDRVVHGALLAALASRFVGMELPGRWGFLLSLKLDFTAPTFPGDEIRVVGQVQSVHEEQRVVVLRLRMSCDGELRARGTAMVRVER